MAMGMKLRWVTSSRGRRPAWPSRANTPTVRKERQIMTAVVRKIPFLEKIVIPKISILKIFLPAVLVKEVEGADGTEDFCQTGKKEDELMKGLEFTKIIYLVTQDV